MTTFDTRTAKNIDLKFYLRDKFKMVVTVTDQDSAAVDLSAKTMVFSVRKTQNGTAVDTLSGGEITVSGASNNIVTIEGTLSGLNERSYYYDLDNTTDNQTIMDGKFIASYDGR